MNMFTWYGKLMEGSDSLIGIEERKTTVFVGRCRLCRFRTGLCEDEADAQEMLRTHCNTSTHRANVNDAAGHDYEATITAQQKP